jgi:hypothetical protein
MKLDKRDRDFIVGWIVSTGGCDCQSCIHWASDTVYAGNCDPVLLVDFSEYRRGRGDDREAGLRQA